MAAFAIYMTGLGFLRFGLAAIYILVWKFRYCCLKRYKIKPIDMDENYQSIRDETEFGQSDDEKEDMVDAQPISLPSLPRSAAPVSQRLIVDSSNSTHLSFKYSQGATMQNTTTKRFSSEPSYKFDELKS